MTITSASTRNKVSALKRTSIPFPFFTVSLCRIFTCYLYLCIQLTLGFQVSLFVDFDRIKCVHSWTTRPAHNLNYFRRSDQAHNCRYESSHCALQYWLIRISNVFITSPGSRYIYPIFHTPAATIIIPARITKSTNAKIISRFI